MGTNFYLYRMKKIGQAALKDLKGSDIEKVDYNKYCVIEQSYIDKHPELFGEIMDILQPTVMYRRELDYHKIKLENNIPLYYPVTAVGIGLTRTYVSFYEETSGRHIRVVGDNPKWERFYTNTPVAVRVCRRKEIVMSHKDWELADLIDRYYPYRVSQSGYYLMPEDTLEAINRYFGKQVLDSSAKNIYYNYG